MKMESVNGSVLPASLDKKKPDLSGFSGRTDQDGTPLDGIAMLLEGKWSEAAKLYGITEKSIPLVLSFLIFCIGLAAFMAGIKWDRSRVDMIYFGAKSYQIVGLSEVPGNPGVYLPLYMEPDNYFRKTHQPQ